jgi:hypothetical protein
MARERSAASATRLSGQDRHSREEALKELQNTQVRVFVSYASADSQIVLSLMMADSDENVRLLVSIFAVLTGY